VLLGRLWHSSYATSPILDPFIEDQLAVGDGYISGFTDTLVCVYFCASTMLFWLLLLWYVLRSGIMMPLALFFLLKIALAIWCLCGSV
jgi:hypothetical protein